MELTRQQLYEMVWAQPVTKVAAKVGLSDRGLAKLCARYDIPLPGRGYWARKEFGHVDRQPALPTGDQPAHRRIQIEKPAADPSAESREAMHPAVLAEQLPENKITVSENSRPTHPLVKATSAVLRAVRPDGYGRLQSAFRALDISVSRSSISRALRIIEALVRALEARGYKVQVTDGKTYAVVLGERIQFALHERAVQKERHLTPEEKRKVVLGEYVYGRHTYGSTGELAITLPSVWGIRNRWVDRKKTRLEDMLNDVIASMVLAAEQEKARRLERERREIEWRKQETRRQEEAARLHDLEQWTAAWEKCERYRAFLAAVGKRFESEPISEKLAKWYAWADAYVAGLDPLR